MTTRVGLYPGTFDPITNGHLDIIGRAVKLVDRLVVGVAINTGKGPMFSVEERVAQVAQECRTFAGRGAEIEVQPFSGLLMHFAEEVGARVIVRGLRAVADFEYEFQMTAMNQQLNREIETVFLMADPRHQAIASRLVKEIATLGGDISSFVTPGIAEALLEKDDPLSLAALALAALLAPAALAAAPAPPPAAEMKTVDPDNLLIIDTNKGRIIAELTPFSAPAHVAQIKALAKRHFYDGQTFFRVLDGFMDQTGDPTNTGKGGSDLPNLKAEFTFRRGADTPFATVAEPSGGEVGYVGPLPVYSQSDALMAMTADGKVSTWAAYCSGVLGMARENEPDTANSQFFFMRATYPALEKRYTAFGRVLIGQDVVEAIKVGEPPADPQDKMVRVRLASDLPPAERPVVRRQDPTGPAFAAAVAAARAAKAADFSVCDVRPYAEATPAK